MPVSRVSLVTLTSGSVTATRSYRHRIWPAATHWWRRPDERDHRRCDSPNPLVARRRLSVRRIPVDELQ
jgi:hypothetical protein